MACTIVKRGLITVNGSAQVWGGVISSFTLNIGIADQKSTASVSVVKKKNRALSAPAPFKEVKIGIAGRGLTMCVKGHSLTTSASSADTLTVQLVDTSYKELDLHMVMLAEMDRGGGDSYNDFKVGFAGSGLKIHIMGEKWIQKTTEDFFGNITPLADGLWMKARPYWLSKQILSFFGIGTTTPMTDQMREDRIINSPGEVLYEVYRMFNKLKISMPPTAAPHRLEKVSYTGTFRDILQQLSNRFGFFYWWDMAAQKIRVSTEIDLNEGLAQLGQIKSLCRVTSQSSTVDASSTYTKAVWSQFDSRWSYTPKAGGSNPARQVRYHYANLLSTSYKFRKCWQKEDVKAKNLTDFGSKAAGAAAATLITDDQLKAMKAAMMGPEIYAAYAMQSVVAANAGGGAGILDGGPWAVKPEVERLQDGEVEKVHDGAGDVQVDDAAVPGNLIAANVGWTSNPFMVELYQDGGPDKGCNQIDPQPAEAAVPLMKSPVCGCSWPIDVGEEVAKVDGNGNATTVREGGFGGTLSLWEAEIRKQNAGELKRNGLLNNAGKLKDFVLFGVKNGAAQTLMGEGRPNATNDGMYRFMRAMGRFMNRFYVVRRGGGAPADWFESTAGVRRTYNYWISTTATPELAPGSNAKLVYDHPAKRLDQCSIPELVDLFRGLEFVYTGKVNEIEVESYPPLLDFVYWLDGNEAKMVDYFSNPAGAAGGGVNKFGRAVPSKFSCMPQTDDDLAETEIQPKMFLAVTGDSMEEVLPANKDITNAVNSFTAADGAWVKAAAHFRKNNQMELFLALETDLYAGVKADKNGQPIPGDLLISALSTSSLKFDAPDRQKMWYSVESGPGQDNISYERPYNFYCNWLALPQMGAKTQVFNAKLEETAVTATELGFSNEEFSEFGSLLASPFSYDNQNTMCNLNRTKAQSQAFFDALPAQSERVTFILSDDDANIASLIPTANEGLQGLSVNIGPAESTVEIVVGNENAKRVAMNAYTNRLNTSFNAYASSAFGSAGVGHI